MRGHRLIVQSLLAEVHKRKEELSTASDELKRARQSMLQYESGEKSARGIVNAEIDPPGAERQSCRWVCGCALRQFHLALTYRAGLLAEKGLEHNTLRNEMQFLKDGTVE